MGRQPQCHPRPITLPPIYLSCARVLIIALQSIEFIIIIIIIIIIFIIIIIITIIIFSWSPIIYRRTRTSACIRVDSTARTREMSASTPRTTIQTTRARARTKTRARNKTMATDCHCWSFVDCSIVDYYFRIITCLWYCIFTIIVSWFIFVLCQANNQANVCSARGICHFFFPGGGIWGPLLSLLSANKSVRFCTTVRQQIGAPRDSDTNWKWSSFSPVRVRSQLPSGKSLFSLSLLSSSCLYPSVKLSPTNGDFVCHFSFDFSSYSSCCSLFSTFITFCDKSLPFSHLFFFPFWVFVFSITYYQLIAIFISTLPSFSTILTTRLFIEWTRDNCHLFPKIM